MMANQEKGRRDNSKGKGRIKRESNWKCRPPELLTGVGTMENEIMLIAARGELPGDHRTDPHYRDDRCRHRLDNYEYRPGECPDDDDTPFIYTSVGIISRPTIKGMESIDPAPTIKRFKDWSAFWASKHSEIPDYTPQPQGKFGKISIDTVVKIRFRGSDRKVEADRNGAVVHFKKWAQQEFRVPADSIILERGQRELEETEIINDCDIELDEIVVVEKRMQKFAHQAVKP